MNVPQNFASQSNIESIEDDNNKKLSDEIVEDPSRETMSPNASLQQNASCEDVSLFSAIRDLFFSPFIDGYCKNYTPFSMAGDYYPPSCPSSACCMGDFGEMREDFDAIGRLRGPQDNPEHFQRVDSASRRPKLKPLAIAVGYNTMTDDEGRHVFITPSSSMRRPTNSPYYQVSPTKIQNRPQESYTSHGTF